MLPNDSLYLARLRLNASRVAALWITNPYRVHQRLLMACGGDPRMLFRIEAGEEPVTILIQSHQPGNWAQAFADFPVLSRPVEQKEFTLRLLTGESYRFRLLANPTVKRNGRRLGLMTENEQLGWLARKLTQAGAELKGCRAWPWKLQHSERNPAKDANMQTHLAVLFEGLLTVGETSALCAAVKNGFGSAKGYGFGLLSLARFAS
jgi:CRISPR system Cascade subunit CasE